MVHACIRCAACHQVNKLVRTAVHEACFENIVDSHGPTIDCMVNLHGCNMLFKDMYGNRAYDELVIARNRPGTPSGTSLREQLLTEGRDELIEARAKEEAEKERLATMKRRDETLRQAIFDGLELDRSGWEMVRSVSQPKHKLPPYQVYVDPDSGNQIFCRMAVTTAAEMKELQASQGGGWGLTQVVMRRIRRPQRRRG